MNHACAMEEWPCPICSKVFTCKEKLRFHLATHCDYKPYVCRYCPYRYSRFSVANFVFLKIASSTLKIAKIRCQLLRKSTEIENRQSRIKKSPNFVQNSSHIWIFFDNCKTNSVQEPCVKCLAVHILKFEILQTIKKIKQKCSVFSYMCWKDRKLNHLMFFVSFFKKVSRFQILMCAPLRI